MKHKQVKITGWLYPVSWLYGVGISIRNELFDRKILRSKRFDVPVINIGNLALGGTGKTPHIEYLVRLLKNNYSVATLSRGYKRKTEGYIVADSKSTAQTIGDEPYQIKTKFPDITVAVDEKRVRGIENLLEKKKPAVDVILLDDAFQHRYVEPGLNILLTDYNHLFCDDALFPVGRLREPAKAKSRAHIVVVTKCPDIIKPLDFKIAAKGLDLYPYQKLYFSRIKYNDLVPAYKDVNACRISLNDLTGSENVLLITGIVSTDDMVNEIKKKTLKVHHIAFEDHHDFTSRDTKRITDKFNALRSSNGEVIIITTEKDAARLQSCSGISDDLKKKMYCLPIEIEILQDRQEAFNQNIIEYVRENKRNR
jgi:tetraacyldisaccharide 4''-kinase